MKHFSSFIIFVYTILFLSGDYPWQTICIRICIQYSMSTKTVYSIRIPVKYRRMMEEMGDVNWQDEIRQMSIKLIQDKSKKKLLKEAEELRKRMKTDVESAVLIREDRNAR